MSVMNYVSMEIKIIAVKHMKTGVDKEADRPLSTPVSS